MPTTIAQETDSSSNTGKLHTCGSNLTKQMELCFVEHIRNTRTRTECLFGVTPTIVWTA